ncbi:Secretion ATPase protein, type II secretion system protein E [Planctomycetales bacterium 10988]|nr:Secretion ATPase protein, type II secretion system protein E [Planctomycetales bacterium 10988]
MSETPPQGGDRSPLQKRRPQLKGIRPPLKARPNQAGRPMPPNRPLPPRPPAAGPAANTPNNTNNAQSNDEQFAKLKSELHQQLIANMDLGAVGQMDDDQLRREVRQAAEELCRLRADLLSLADRERLIEEVLDEVFGFGPLEILLRDPSISDILINGPKIIYVERRGRLERTDVTFRDEPHLLQIIQRICNRVGRRVDETCPMVDARLPDGSRVNAIIPPLALDGSLVSIRRFSVKPLLAEDLVRYGSITTDIVQFLSAAVRSRMNILVSGGTGSGKTTLLNLLSGYIQEDHRVATIEDAAELRLQQPHVVRMETRAPNIEGKGEVTARDLVKNALRMRPDRVVVGECRGGEALDMLQAMNTGHDGCMTTIHANTSRDALGRLEMLVGMAGFDVPIWIIRKQITSAIHMIVQAARLMGGARKILQVSELTGMEGDTITMHDIFIFHQTGVDENGNTQGYFAATGNRPHCTQRLKATGNALPDDFFERRIMTTEGPSSK